MIQIVNQTDLDLTATVAAINTQVNRDFGQFYAPTTVILTDKDNGKDWPVYVVKEAQDAPPGAAGWHTVDSLDRPYGIVPLQDQLSLTLSHEVLELIPDPFASLAAETTYHGHDVMVAWEICDAVEYDSYEIDGITVSNFVLPTWFLYPAIGSRFDWLGLLSEPLTMTSGGFLYYYWLGRWHMESKDRETPQTAFRRMARRAARHLTANRRIV